MTSSILSSNSRWSTNDLYKYIGIILLTLQQSTMPLMVRSARDREEKSVFITTVNVFLMDVIKLTVCAIVLVANERSLFRFFCNVKKAVVEDPIETAKICVPALIYNLQNNLYYIALSNLESTTFCVAYQMKILTTALMLRLVLKKPLSGVQWFALVVLVAGVANVQIQYQPPVSAVGSEQNPNLGFLMVLTMCFTSAFAGVYMEKILKQSSVDVWMQNVRLALFGLVISAVSMLFKDYDNIKENGFFMGFDALVWAYAQSMAIVGAAIGSWILFDFVPNQLFVLGTVLVMLSIYLYTAYPFKQTVDIQFSDKAKMIK